LALKLVDTGLPETVTLWVEGRNTELGALLEGVMV
jgi:hypothetical protein